MCRAAQHLLADPAVPLRQLAARLGVGERSLSCGLRTILGTDPCRLAWVARRERSAAHPQAADERARIMEICNIAGGRRDDQ